MLRPVAALLLSSVVTVLGCSETRQPMLSVTSTTTELAPGKTAQLTVTRQFPGGPIETVTNAVHYVATPRDVVTVSGTGLVSPGVESGTAEVRISDWEDSASTSLRFTVVVEGALAAITVTPNPAVVAVGASLPLSAIGHRSNGQTDDLTRAASWSSTDEEKATVDPNGVVTGISKGVVTITAKDTAGLVRGSTALTVQ